MDVLGILVTIILVVVGGFFCFWLLVSLLPALTTVWLGQYLWSCGHDNLAVIVFIVGGIFSILWFFGIQDWY